MLFKDENFDVRATKILSIIDGINVTDYLNN
jgi:hypothetical protein